MVEFGHPRVLPDDEVGSAVSVGIAEVGSPGACGYSEKIHLNVGNNLAAGRTANPHRFKSALPSPQAKITGRRGYPRLICGCTMSRRTFIRMGRSKRRGGNDICRTRCKR